VLPADSAPLRSTRSVFSFFLAGLLLLASAACGVPGPPVPPTPKIPVVPENLTAQQVGERVILRWQVRLLNTDGSRRADWPQLQVYRAFLPAGEPYAQSFSSQAHVAYTIPNSLVDVYLHEGTIVFDDALDAATLREHAGHLAVYALKALNEKGQDAGFSKLTAVQVHPVPTPIRRLQARVTPRSIELQWEPPTRTTGGAPIEAIAGYEIYRSETGDEGSFVLYGNAATAQYEDTRFRFNQPYYYRVRSLAQYGATTVPSGDSTTAEVTPQDVFPPPVPQNLIAVAGVGRVDLTWDASVADDLQGYIVYRSRESGRDYQRRNSKLLVAQTFAEVSDVEAGTRYYYVVTAVDKEGNESPFSAEVSAVPLPSE
jgi:predicted phage tail protein